MAMSGFSPDASALVRAPKSLWLLGIPIPYTSLEPVETFGNRANWRQRYDEYGKC
jgi:hypothetical protein